MGCHTASSGSYLRHFYSDSEATVQCELFLIVPNKNILTYLHCTLSRVNKYSIKLGTHKSELSADIFLPYKTLIGHFLRGGEALDKMQPGSAHR